MVELMLTKHNAGEELGVTCSTGPVTPSADNAGHIGLEMNALVSEFTITKPSGNVIEVNAVFKPHADNTDTTVPRLYKVPAA